MRGPSRPLHRLLLLATVATGTLGLGAQRAAAQTLTPFAPGSGAIPGARPNQGPTLTPLPVPKLSPGVMELIKLESQFAEDVAKGGGKAFASWFADDGVTLSNGKPPVLGRAAIAATAQWDPAQYQLTWYAEGAQTGPAGDTGFTWGHYDATTRSKDGTSTSASGRYITFWKKVDGRWKVALEASADGAPPAAM